MAERLERIAEKVRNVEEARLAEIGREQKEEEEQLRKEKEEEERLKREEERLRRETEKEKRGNSEMEISFFQFFPQNLNKLFSSLFLL